MFDLHRITVSSPTFIGLPTSGALHRSWRGVASALRPNLDFAESYTSRRPQELVSNALLRPFQGAKRILGTPPGVGGCALALGASAAAVALTAPIWAAALAVTGTLWMVVRLGSGCSQRTAQLVAARDSALRELEWRDVLDGQHARAAAASRGIYKQRDRAAGKAPRDVAVEQALAGVEALQRELSQRLEACDAIEAGFEQERARFDTQQEIEAEAVRAQQDAFEANLDALEEAHLSLSVERAALREEILALKRERSTHTFQVTQKLAALDARERALDERESCLMREERVVESKMQGANVTLARARKSAEEATLRVEEARAESFDIVAKGRREADVLRDRARAELAQVRGECEEILEGAFVDASALIDSTRAPTGKTALEAAMRRTPSLEGRELS